MLAKLFFIVYTTNVTIIFLIFVLEVDFMLKKIIFSTAIILISLFLCSAGCETISGGGGGSSSGGGYTGGTSDSGGGSSGGGSSGGGSSGGGSGSTPPKPVPLTKIEFANANISIAKDMTLTISDIAPLIFTPSNATNKKVTYSIESNSFVELVDGTKLKSVAKGGPITLTATSADGNRNATCKITVTEYIPLNSISLTTDKVSLAVGETINVADLVVFDPQNASNKALSYEIPVGSAWCISAVDNNGTIKVMLDPGDSGIGFHINVTPKADNVGTKVFSIYIGGTPPTSNPTVKTLSDGMKVVTGGNNAIPDDGKIYAAIRLVAERTENDFRQATKSGYAYPKDFHFQLKPQGSATSQFLHVFGTSGKQFSNTYNDNTGYAQNNFKKIDTGFYFTHEFFEIGTSGLSFENVVMQDREKKGELMGEAYFFFSDVNIPKSLVGMRGANDSNIALFTVKFEPRDTSHPNTIDKVSVTFDGFVPKN